ncbi:hypothetical protein [Microbacterium gilvum]|uniref:NTF2-like N-terminal transpeptidase domain-containing protein n=1 Tax=Microbacterium gilvum TaxID=1336204 RepID=A0ABP8ZWR3_9MICO
MKRPLIPVLALIAAVVIGMIVVGFWTASRPAGAQDVAARFADALATGDADAARALLQDPTAVTEEAWTAFSGAEHLTLVDEAVVTEDDDTARAEVPASLGDEPIELSFPLVRTDDGWRVAEAPLGTLSVTSSRGELVEVADQPIALEGGAARVDLLPGVYPVSAWPAAYLDGGADVAVAPAGEADAALDPAFTEEARTQAEEQLAAYIDGCLATAAEVPAGCGMVVPWPADLAELDEISFRAETLPSPVVDLEAGTFAAEGGSVVVTATGLRADGSEAEFSYRSDTWSLRGTVSVDDEGLLLSVF